MVNFPTSETIIPTLSFTKAELAYALFILLSEIPITDNQTKLELVELRFYLNQIKDRVAKAVSDGTLQTSVLGSSNDGNFENVSNQTKESTQPSINELRISFPHLTDEEITEILEKATATNKNLTITNRMPSLPSLIVKPKENQSTHSPIGITKQTAKNTENAIKFSKLLGQM